VPEVLKQLRLTEGMSWSWMVSALVKYVNPEKGKKYNQNFL
jgi:hypothetical protein